MLAFWRKGFASTSMNDLCDAMGVRSPSLYAAFGSKEALYIEALDHYVRGGGPPVWEKLGEGATARSSFEALLVANAESLPESQSCPAGCMAMLAAVGDEWPIAVAEAAKKIRMEMLGMLRSRLEAGAVKGELPPSIDIDSLSRFYLGILQGMAVQARDGAGSKELKGLAVTAMAAWPGDGRN
jgi:AcrR family transcriptional regulator